jgi:plastocyanin
MRTGALLTIAAALVVCTGAAPSQPKPEVHTVTIAEMRFTPQTLRVARGDLVVWVNKDIVPHTATSEEGGFDSKTIASNASWTFRARKTGKFDYICTLHPTMKAVLQIK